MATRIREPDADNSRWLSAVLTALPVILAAVLVAAFGQPHPAPVVADGSVPQVNGSADGSDPTFLVAKAP